MAQISRAAAPRLRAGHAIRLTARVSGGVKSPPLLRRARLPYLCPLRRGGGGERGGRLPPPRQPRGSATASPSPPLIRGRGANQLWGGVRSPEATRRGNVAAFRHTHDVGGGNRRAIRIRRLLQQQHLAPPPVRRRRQRQGDPAWSSHCRAPRDDRHVCPCNRGWLPYRWRSRRDGHGRRRRASWALSPRKAAWTAAGRRGRPGRSPWCDACPACTGRSAWRWRSSLPRTPVA
jgi:hypothetical protein